jgi:hypothetical protein
MRARKDFLSRTQKALTPEEKKNELDFFRVETFAYQEDTVKKIGKPHIGRKCFNIFHIYMQSIYMVKHCICIQNM